ncbi:hypothetical protein ACCO45_010703 [Purpureocillium lilacinum]|uniref:Uncharacterized protein n=1 Tax=Purpureocillium lilacinum TaxID=33203 RepID=A0ACC4DFI6_PURLI
MLLQSRLPFPHARRLPRVRTGRYRRREVVATEAGPPCRGHQSAADDAVPGAGERGETGRAAMCITTVLYLGTGAQAAKHRTVQAPFQGRSENTTVHAQHWSLGGTVPAIVRLDSQKECLYFLAEHRRRVTMRRSGSGLAPWNGEVHVEKNSAPERGSPSICRPATWSFASMICCRRCWGADATFGTGRTTAAAAAASIAFPGAGPLEVGETSVPRQPVPPRDFLTILPSATRGPSHVAGFQCIPSSSTRSTHALVASCHGVLLVPIGLSCRIYPTTNHTKLERQPASASS